MDKKILFICIYAKKVVLSTYSPKGTLRMVVRALRDMHKRYF